MRPYYWKLNADGDAVPTDDAIEWGHWFETANRTVSNDLDEGDDGKTIRVSTVFLGLDHNFGADGPPVLWETLVFGGVLDGEMMRYSSKEAAAAGHQAICRRVMETLHGGGPGKSKR